jgi:hypothetical protein
VRTGRVKKGLEVRGSSLAHSGRVEMQCERSGEDGKLEIKVLKKSKVIQIG